ncbi:ATP-binding protein [Desulfoglaeba alkanexedens]|uniref:ATP-binding protein n=1 Tax=Desulfoglaeba alkanexedens TaxID=361111 RepID=UPI001B85D788
MPSSKEGSELLFQVFAERYEKGSMIITTNLGSADWPHVPFRLHYKHVGRYLLFEEINGGIATGSLSFRFRPWPVVRTLHRLSGLPRSRSNC